MKGIDCYEEQGIIDIGCPCGRLHVQMINRMGGGRC